MLLPLLPSGTWKHLSPVTTLSRCSCRHFPWDTQQLLIQLKYQHDGQDLNTTSTLLPSESCS